MPIALLTTYLAPYRVPLFELLAERHGVEVLCFGGGRRYVPSWLADLDAQLAAAPFPARRLGGPREVLSLGRRYDAVIAPFAGGSILPLSYAGARRYGSGFVLWASVWSQPRSLAHAVALPATRHIYRHADAIVAYGDHARRFVAKIRGHDDDVFVAPQSVEAELFGRTVSAQEIDRFRSEHAIPDGPIVLYAGRLVPEKGVQVLLEAWRSAAPDATLVLIGDGPLFSAAAATPGARALGPIERARLPAAYASSAFAVVPSIPTPRFREPWGLVVNEAMHQARPVIATTSVGAAAGGLVRDGQTGLIVPALDTDSLGGAIERLLADAQLRERLGRAARAAVADYNYGAMAAAFDRALALALSRSPSRSSPSR